jgi:O-succinylbenzoic acid--CoA ligase
VAEGHQHEMNQDVFLELGKYEKPKEIYFVPKFKETETGKIIRKETLEMI